MKIDKPVLMVAIILLITLSYLSVTFGSNIVFGDEGYHSTIARWTAQNLEMPTYEIMRETDIFHPPYTKPPLFVTTASFWFLFGEAGVKFMIPIFAAITALLLYLFMKEIGHENAGIIGATLYMLTPSLITYAVMTYVDSLLIMLIAATMYFGHKAINDDKKIYLYLTGIFGGLACLTKITAPIIFIILFLYMIFTKKINFKKILIVLLIAILIVSPWMVRNLMLFGDFCYGPAGCEGIQDQEIEIIEGLRDNYAGRTSGGGTEASLAAIGGMAYSSFAYGWVILLLFVIGLAFIGKKDYSILLLLFILCMIPVFMFYSHRTEDLARYSLPVIIPMCLIGGLFLEKTYNWIKEKNKTFALIVIILIVASAIPAANEKLQTMKQVKTFSEGFYKACDWVKLNTPEDSLLLSIYSQQTAYACERDVSTAVPDVAEMTITYDERAYKHMKDHGYDYIFVMANLISNVPYSETLTIEFIQYMEGSNTLGLIVHLFYINFSSIIACDKMIDWLIAIVCIFAAFFGTIYLTKKWMFVAKNIKLMGKDMNKYNKTPVAEGGGVAVTLTITFTILLYIFFKTFLIGNSTNMINIFSVLVTIVIAGFVGFMDDMLGWLKGIRRKTKVLLTFGIALPLVVVNAGQSLISIPFIGTIELGLVYPLVIVPIALIGAANGYNILAGMNGLEAGLGVIIISTLSYVAMTNGLIWLATIGMITVVSLLGFLIFNKYPSKIFPGDSLTYVIGALIACMAILGNMQAIAIILFIPYFLDFILLARAKKDNQVSIGAFGIPDKNNALKLPGEKVYDMTHVGMFLLSKVKKNVYEMDVVLFIWGVEALCAILVLTMFV